MKSIAAGKFRNVCLKTLDDVAATKTSVVITKRGRPVAMLVPYVQPAKKRGLAGSVLKEVGRRIWHVMRPVECGRVCLKAPAAAVYDGDPADPDSRRHRPAP